MNSLKIKGSGQDSNFSNSVPRSEENVNAQFSISDKGEDIAPIGNYSTPFPFFVTFRLPLIFDNFLTTITQFLMPFFDGGEGEIL